MCLYSIPLINSLHFTVFITKLELPKPARTNQCNMIISTIAKFFVTKFFAMPPTSKILAELDIKKAQLIEHYAANYALCIMNYALNLAFGR